MSDKKNKKKNWTHFLGSEIEQGGDDAFFQILPVPLELSTSYGEGTVLGPFHILDASWQLEMFDGKTRPCDLGIHTHSAIECTGKSEQIQARIEARVAEILKTRNLLKEPSFPVVIGGEHAVTPAVIQGYLDAGITDFGVVQIDAHADLRDSYENNRNSHACAMRRIVEKDIPLFQLGVRAFCEEEIQARETYSVSYLDADTLVPNRINEFELPNDFPSKVFFTLDIDGLDPSVFPSTGTPVPGGLGWYQTLSLFESVAEQRQIIGFDIMEFSPIEGFHAYEFAAAQLIYKMMGIVQRSNT